MEGRGGAHVCELKTGTCFHPQLAYRLVSAWICVAGVLAAGCDTIQIDQRVVEDGEVYVVEHDTETPPGALEVEAVAYCEDGDAVVAGGCSWGEVLDAHDAPLRPLVDAPTDDGDGWRCVGQNPGVGVELKTVIASAVCSASG
jgi:hypothetical protein